MVKTSSELMNSSDSSMGRIAALEARLAADPSSLAFLPLAEAYRGVGKPEDAERVLVEGLERHPDHHSARTALGRVLLERARMARDQLRRVVEQAPENLLARQLLEEASARAPGEPEPTGAAAEEREHSHQEPPRDLSADSDPSPADELSSLTLADLYLRQGDWARALEIYREILAREPENQELQEKVRRLEAEHRSSGAGPTTPEQLAPVDEIKARRARRLARLRQFLNGAARARETHAP